MSCAVGPHFFVIPSLVAARRPGSVAVLLPAAGSWSCFTECKGHSGTLSTKSKILHKNLNPALCRRCSTERKGHSGTYSPET